MLNLNARVRAYLALLSSMRGEGYIIHALERMQRESPLSSLDFAFAHEIAAGACRMSFALDYVAKKLAHQGKLSLKAKEKALLQTALYQHLFMDRVPLYAITNETMEIAKKYCHPTFAKFLHALMRRLNDCDTTLPEGNSIKDLSIHFSYPEMFVKDILTDYGLEEAKAIFKAGNIAPKMMVRVRGNQHLNDIAYLFEKSLSAGVVNSKADITKSSDLYIQNATPILLLNDLSEVTHLSRQAPISILDLCASPGGKLLAAHDLFPNAILFANDVSKEKLVKLNENIAKYGLNVAVTEGRGEDYSKGKFGNEKFDLIILDVPCSNSGVLNKRPEARHRLHEKAQEELFKTQLNLLEAAVTMLKPKGEIWLMTCSLLKKENQALVHEICNRHQLKNIWMKTILPNCDGWDGGFACLLKRQAE